MNPALLKKRIGAFIIDFFIVYLCRYLYSFLTFRFILKNYLIEFINLWKDKFGKLDLNKITVVEVDFLINSKFFKIFIVWFFTLFLVSVVYNFCFLITQKSATLGQRYFKIYILNDDKTKITKLRAFLRSFLAVIPWIFISYVIIFNQLFYLADKMLLNNVSFILILVIFATWFDTSLFTKNKLTFHDFLSRTIVVSNEFYEHQSFFVKLKNIFNFKQKIISSKSFIHKRIEWAKEFKDEILFVKKKNKKVKKNKKK